MKLILDNTLRVQNPTQEVYKWCRENLIIANPEYTNKTRMGLWVGNTPARLYLYSTDGDDLIIPYGCLKPLTPLFTDCEIESRFSQPVNVDYSDPVPLYDYQEIAVEEAYKGLYGIIQSKAGSGKTQMGIALAKKWGRRTLWLTHTLDLLNQSKNRALQYMDESLIGTISEGKVNIGKGITFATIQTMSHIDLAQFKNVWDVIIVDECHRVAGSPTQMTMFSKVLNALSARHKYGLSATVHRSDGTIKSAYALIGEVVYAVPESAIADKIMQVGIVPVGTGTQLSQECLNTDGTINYAKMINYLCEDTRRNEIISSRLLESEGHYCLILSDRVAHLHTLMSMLPTKMLSQAAFIDGKMTSKKGKAEREQVIEDMRTGKKRYLFATYRLAKEGLDIPRLDRLYMTTPQRDYAVVAQSIGRIARTFKGKDNPICYDFVDDIQSLVKSYKARCRTYNKENCYFVEG